VCGNDPKGRDKTLLEEVRIAVDCRKTAIKNIFLCVKL
jgi:hypothetical protein